MKKDPIMMVFDLDGTLVDSLGSTVELIQRSVKSTLGRELTAETILEKFGKPEEKIFSELFAPAEAPIVMEKYLNLFEQNIGNVLLFEGVFAGLKDLVKAGFKIGLYTARGRHTSEIIFGKRDLHQFFEVIVTGSEVSLGKPHPEGLITVLNKINLVKSRNQNVAELGDSGFSAENLVYIGDSPKDILMAKSIGAQSVGVHWCHQCDRSALAATSPDQLFGVPAEMFKFLKSLGQRI